MALVPSVPTLGDQRPLLGSPDSPVDASPPPPAAHHRVRWGSLQTLEAELDDGLAGKAPPPASLSSMLSTDSGCESEGVADSVYSTVTSCTSDLVRMQLDSELAEQEEQETEQEPEPEPPEPVEPPPTVSCPQQVEPLEDCRVRSWSLEARGCAADEEAASAVRADELEMVTPLRHALSEPSLVTSASTASMPICRICHMPSEERAELISPCRCAGTMQYIHTACLMHWIEVSSRRAKRPPCCELCQYQYQRHKRFRVGRWLVPAVSTRDKLLHALFVITAIVMVTCAVITIFCFKQDSGKRRLAYDEAELTSNETVTLVCGILFFASFFVGMYCEIKAKYSIYQLVTRVFYLNQQWFIEEYDRSKDDKFRCSPTGGSPV